MYDLFIQSGEIFLHLLNMSIAASWLVLAIVLVRLVFKKSPKWVNCLLWGLVAIRLLVPFNIESEFSLVPSGETMPVGEIYNFSEQVGDEVFSPQVNSGIEVVDSVLQPALNETSAQPVLQSNISIVACVWLAGIVAMLIYSLISYLKVRKSVREAMHVQENIFLCDNISTPFILGIIRPKIYLPSSLYRDDVLYVIDHEKAHIKRLDHLWKPLGFLILSVYWFNPAIWIAYILLCKDIELACDEKVIKELDAECKKEYSTALINCSSQRRLVSACPLAFGETGVKNRIKSVLSYKKPAFWVILVAIVLCGAVSVGFLTVRPKEIKKSAYYEYVYYGSREPVKPKLVLKNDGTFTFNFSSYSNYLAKGRYTEEENLLTLNTDDGQNVYIFDITVEGYVFDAYNSSKIPVYRTSEASTETYCPVPDKALFIKNQPVGANSYFDATVLEVTNTSILVEPFADEAINNSANKLQVSLIDAVVADNAKIQVGDSVRICYDGMIQETFPAQINGTIAVFLLDSSEQTINHLGGEGIEYVEMMTRWVADELTGEISEYTEKITDKNKIELFVKRFNQALDSSSVDEIDSVLYPDTVFDEIIFINVYYSDGSNAKVTILGFERIRLGINERRLISAYDRQLIVDALKDTKEKIIDEIIKGQLGRVDLSDKEFLEKAYSLTCDVSYGELCEIFGEAPFGNSYNNIETYYYFNDEYVLFVEEGVGVYLRKISDPDYRHTIG